MEPVPRAAVPAKANCLVVPTLPQVLHDSLRRPLGETRLASSATRAVVVDMEVGEATKEPV